GPTRTAVAFAAKLADHVLTFYPDGVSPETAPFKDKETGTRWTLAGRGVDGPLRGKELGLVDSVQCRWYAWAAEHPQTTLHVRDQRSEIRGQRSEIRSQRSEVRDQKSEVRDQESRPEVGHPRSLTSDF